MVKNKLYSEAFETAFLDFIRKDSLIDKGETVLIAYSGGIDSSVLLHLLNVFKKDLEIELIIAYFNHNLRGEESEKEVQFIEKTAADYGLSLEIGTGDVMGESNKRGISIQESARYLRYDFFQKTAEKYDADKIATGHNRDDQAETVLMRFFLGSNLKGIRGIPVRRGMYIRPLLWASRSELQHYADTREISYFEDSSNKKTGYLRNKIRLEILPFLREKLGTNIDLILVKHGQKFQNAFEMIDSLTFQALDSTVVSLEKDKIILDIASFKNYFTILKQSILSECFKRLGETNDSLNVQYAHRVLDFLNGTFKRKSMYITKELYTFKDKNHITICRDRDREFEQSIEIGKEYTFSEERFHFHAEVIDAHSVKLPEAISEIKNRKWDEVVDHLTLVEPLILRSWRAGDSFRPLGMQNSKKLSDFFIDLKIPINCRKRLPILVDQEKIVWVCGMRIDDRVKVSAETREVVGLKYSRMH